MKEEYIEHIEEIEDTPESLSRVLLMKETGMLKGIKPTGILDDIALDLAKSMALSLATTEEEKEDINLVFQHKPELLKPYCRELLKTLIME